MERIFEELPREECMGSTDCNAAAGTNRYKGPNKLFLAKTGEPQKSNAYMELSLLTEDALRKITEVKLAASGIDVCLKEGKTFFWREDGVNFRTTPDGLAYASKRHRKILYAVEMKNSFNSPRSDYGEEWSEDVREDYYDQCVQHCALTPAPACLLSVWFHPTQWPEMFIVKANPERWEELKATGKAFWKNHVETGIPPELDETEWARKAQLRRDTWEDKIYEVRQPERVVLADLEKKKIAYDKAESEFNEARNKVVKMAADLGVESLRYNDKNVATFKENKNGVRVARITYKNFSDLGANND